MKELEKQISTILYTYLFIHIVLYVSQRIRAMNKNVNQTHSKILNLNEILLVLALMRI